MRHQKQGRKLGRTAQPRKALLRSLATSFILKGKIQTTKAKAKELKPIVEKLITTSKTNTLASRRKLLEYIYDEKAVSLMLDKIGPKYKERKGGYTRIIALENRKGDNAQMAKLELV